MRYITGMTIVIQRFPKCDIVFVWKYSSSFELVWSRLRWDWRRHWVCRVACNVVTFNMAPWWWSLCVLCRPSLLGWCQVPGQCCQVPEYQVSVPGPGAPMSWCDQCQQSLSWPGHDTTLPPTLISQLNIKIFAPAWDELLSLFNLQPSSHCEMQK